jgi:hypothetical protein
MGQKHMVDIGAEERWSSVYGSMVSALVMESVSKGWGVPGPEEMKLISGKAGAIADLDYKAYGEE